MKLSVTKRDILGKKVKRLRKEDLVPASLFGPGVQPLNLSVVKKDFIKVFKEVGYNQFFGIDVEGVGKRKVLVKHLQLHPVTDRVVSIGFYQVAEDRKITVDVPIQFNGEAPVVKLNLGFLVMQFESLPLHCYPKDLPSLLEVDISSIEDVSDTILISSVKLPEGVELDSGIDPESAIVYVATAQKAEVESTEVATGDGSAVSDPTNPSPDVQE